MKIRRAWKIRQDGRENPPSDLDKNGDLRYDRKRFTVEWYRSGYNGHDSKCALALAVFSAENP